MKRPRNTTRRARTLDEARRIVTRDRARQHGDAAQTYEAVAEFWTVWIKARHGIAINLDAYDCLMMLAAMKIGRAAKRPRNLDNYVDGAGYLALASELLGER